MANATINLALRDSMVKDLCHLIASSRAGSISAFVEYAVRIALNDAAEWEETLATALEQTGGPLTPEERAWADSILSPAPRKPRRPRRRKRD